VRLPVIGDSGPDPELISLAERARSRVVRELMTTQPPASREAGGCGWYPAWPTEGVRLVYATDLAEEGDQLAGWGLKVVVDSVRERGINVRYIPHPPESVVTRPDAWLLSLPYAGDTYRLAHFFSALGISPDRARRSGEPPFVLGGHGVLNPEPFLGVADVVFVGEADDRAGDLVSALAGGPEEVQAVPGADVFGCGPVEFQVASGLDRRKVYQSEGGHGAGPAKYLEVGRGCKGGCRFCELGWLYGYDERPREEVEEHLAEHGGDLVLSAPDTDGVSYFADLMADGLYTPRWRSTRVTPYVRSQNQTRSSGRMKIRFGVEGFTERLRKLTGKAITDHRLRSGLSRAATEGYQSVRVFLIAGLPTETTADRTHVVEILRILSESGFRHHNACDVKVTGLSPQPLTPWQREGIGGAIEGLAELHEWRRRMSRSDPWWSRIMLDRHTTEADVVKHMGRGDLVPYLEARARLWVDGPPGLRWAVTRRVAKAAGIDYDRMLDRWSGELPWSRLTHPHSEIQKRGERSWERARGAVDEAR